MMMPPSPPPNPALQALLDAIPHTPVPFTIQDGPIPGTNPPQMTTMILCEAHKQVICQTCGVHFGSINYMFNFLKGAPAEAIPPPPNAPTQPQRAEAIKQAKEAGNVRRTHQCTCVVVDADVPERLQATTIWSSRCFVLAFGRYGIIKTTMGTLGSLEGRDSDRSLQQISSICIHGQLWRSFSRCRGGGSVKEALDKGTFQVCQLGHTELTFRKARALVGMDRLEEAKDALIDGLQFEPNDKVRLDL